VDRELRAAPIVDLALAGSAAPREGAVTAADAPLRGIRVLDLTRVIAGPVATRTLALLGADVLRIDPPQLPEPEWQHFDSGHGKRSTLLDLAAAADRQVFDGLLERADVVVTGYRARALERLGLAPDDLIARHPGLIVGRLTAWGSTGASADRRGFDSLVQAASGIAWVESPDGERPGALPAQALDHSAGYLLAAGVLTALHRAQSEGGSWVIDVSLRRVAAELLGLPRTTAPEPGAVAGGAAHIQEFDVDGLHLTSTAPALAYDGGPVAFRAPRRWGRDPAHWREQRRQGAPHGR
jgi:crotonobetainyl-CoA:carnitine CoA-transferase CaiB-like acyl-CoA transferase